MIKKIKLRDINSRYLHLIDIARNLKTQLQTGRVFVMAFMIKSNRILTMACNSYKAKHPEGKFGPYKALKTNKAPNYQSGLHAEIHALKNLGPDREDISKIELFVVRIGNEESQPTMDAFPCKNCCRVLKEYKFKRITFTTNNPYKIGEIKCKDI